MESGEGYFGERVAESYDEHSAGMFDPAVVGPAVDTLAELAGGGRALEFAIGTGRIALPLAERGVRVAGIDGSEAMLARLSEKPGAERIVAVAGDMATTRVEGEFSLAYLVFNTIFNLTTQDGQVACFENAAAHLGSGGRFVIEARVPELQRLPLGQTVLPWRADPDGISYYVYDVVTQRLSGRHYHVEDGALRPSPIEMRYAWPAELDLMARLGHAARAALGRMGPRAVHGAQPRARVGLREVLAARPAGTSNLRASRVRRRALASTELRALGPRQLQRRAGRVTWDVELSYDLDAFQVLRRAHLAERVPRVRGP